MSLSPTKTRKHINAAVERPYLDFLPYSLNELMMKTLQAWFAKLDCEIEIYFANHGLLACIFNTPEEKKAVILIHLLLNHASTPKLVMNYIIKHELIHLVVPPRVIKGRVKHHPPEFREMENRIAPEKDTAWEWISVNFCYHLNIRPRLERTDVMNSWMRSWGNELWTIKECES